MESHTRELARLLPHSISEKLRYYLDYINDCLIDIALEEKAYHRLKEIRGYVESVFLLRLLYGYFVVGLRNYEQMLDYFESIGVNGFQFSRTDFTRDSSLTTQWRQVADDFERLVSKMGITSYVRPFVSVDEVLRRIIRSLPDMSEQD